MFVSKGGMVDRNIAGALTQNVPALPTRLITTNPIGHFRPIE